MSEIFFYKLPKPEKALLLCEITEKYLLDGKRVLVIVEDQNQGVSLDRFMWTWSKGSFIPHVYENGAVECMGEPVVITIREENPNGAQVLVMGKPCRHAFISRFETVIDFAELHNEDAANASRKRFASYRDAGLNPKMFE